MNMSWQKRNLMLAYIDMASNESHYHKISIHGSALIVNALLPIGYLIEQAAEARNKHFHLYRENYE